MIFSFDSEWIATTTITLKKEMWAHVSQNIIAIYIFVTDLSLQCFDSRIEANLTPFFLFEPLIVEGGIMMQSLPDPSPSGIMVTVHTGENSGDMSCFQIQIVSLM
mmetsp:Transcript_44205/g.82628  ORF Transcript_44205/g.82628 Transcript_44205/m.82628 type:complete len:105 (-) Transcript_44205:330-644(-)